MIQMQHGAKITGTGSALPEMRVSNQDIVARLAVNSVETSNQWIRERTGISERRFSDLSNPHEHNSSLGFTAATKALEMAGKHPGEIDQIIYATCSPDTLLPSTACWLQHKLGAVNAWAMDLNGACSGFIYGLGVAEQFIGTGKTKTALVVGGEVLHPYINWEDRNSSILFGDGAGAAVVAAAPADTPRRILSSHLKSDGHLWELLIMPGGGSSMEVTPEVYAQNLHKLRMSGKEIFKAAVRTLSEYAHIALDANGMTIEDIDWFLPHQANRRILEAVAQRLRIPDQKVLINLDRYGNTSAATVPILLDEAVRDGRIQPGHLILMDVFGAGLTYGSLLMRW